MPVQVVCHRGANQLAPENTYASSQICIDWGVDYLEIDINTSKDGVPYVFHGPDLGRTTNGSGRIYDLHSAELDGLDCGSWFGPQFSDQRIPRLDEFLIWLDGRVKLFFDVKWAKLSQLRDLVYQHQLQDTCFFWFGRDRFARELAALDPDLQLKINVSAPEEVARAVETYGATIVEFSLDDCSADMLATCRRYGVRSMVLYKHCHQDDFTRIINSGVDLVNLDHGHEFLALRDQLASTD